MTSTSKCKNQHVWSLERNHFGFWCHLQCIHLAQRPHVEPPASSSFRGWTRLTLTFWPRINKEPPYRNKLNSSGLFLLQQSQTLKFNSLRHKAKKCNLTEGSLKRAGSPSRKRAKTQRDRFIKRKKKNDSNCFTVQTHLVLLRSDKAVCHSKCQLESNVKMRNCTEEFSLPSAFHHFPPCLQSRLAPDFNLLFISSVWFLIKLFSTINQKHF